MTRKRTPESFVLDAVMQYLAVKKIFAIRMNSGAVKVDNRFLRFGSPGMADVLALKDYWNQGRGSGAVVAYWIEAKAPNGKQSEAQKAFQQRVEAEGHIYIVAKSIEDLGESWVMRYARGYDPPGVRQIKKLIARDRSKALMDLYWAVDRCVQLYGYVEVQAGDKDLLPYPRIGITWKGQPPL